MAFKRSGITAMIHIAAWLIFFSLVLGFMSASDSTDSLMSLVFSFPFLIFCLVYILLFYLNTYVLVPLLFVRKKIMLYALIILSLFAAVWILRPFDNLLGSKQNRNGPPSTMQQQQGPPPMEMDHFGPPPNDGGSPPNEGKPRRDRQGKPGNDIVSVILFIAVWSMSTAACIIRQWRETEQRAAVAEADKANAELSFLKARINPHFLFNTLNNIYSLAVSGSEHTADSIMKLSNIMRYVTDEVQTDYVSVEQELSCIRDYIDLQRLRLSKKITVDFQVKEDAQGGRIAPLLLMTFIENVFKHGISAQGESQLIIHIQVKDQRLELHCKNPIVLRPISSERSGVGLSNTLQRLDMLYPGQYSLNISKNGFYTVDLSMPV